MNNLTLNRKLLAIFVVSVFLVSTLLIAAPVKAYPPSTNDWPMFQGNPRHTGVAFPGLNGISAALLTESWKYTTDNTIGPGSPSLADIDADGKLEVLIGTANFASTGGVYALKSDGSLKWKHQTSDYGTYDTPNIADIDGDGRMEIAFVSYAGKIVVLKDDGTAKWVVNKGSAGTKSLLADVNGDGKVEVVAGAAGKIWCLDATGVELWNRPYIVGTAIALADVDGDGGSELVFSALGTNKIVALNADGTDQWSSPAAGQDFQVSLSIVNDVNGDGKPDVVAGSRDKSAYAYSGADGSKLWSYLTVGRVFGIAGGDITGDGKDEVVATATKGDGVQSYVYLLDKSGILLWSQNVIGANAYTTAPTPAIIDVNKDGVQDIVVASQNKKFYALNGFDGSELWAFTWTAGGPEASSPAIADLDGDGTMDIVFATGNAVHTITVLKYPLTISVSPVGGGTTNPSVGTYQYESGSSVDVTATAASGYTFDSWFLDGTNAGSYPITVTMNAPHNLVAQFLSPNAIKSSVLQDLITLRDSGTVTDKGDLNKLDEAIKHLTKSLEPELWVDETRLDPKHGEKVFQEEKDAVVKLLGLMKDKKSTIPVATLQGFINRLASADRLLASAAIHDAVAASGDAKKIDKANDELGKGDARFADNHFTDAIEHYRNAWKQAIEAV